MKLSGNLSWVFADLDGSATLDASDLSISDSLLFTAGLFLLKMFKLKSKPLFIPATSIELIQEPKKPVPPRIVNFFPSRL
jgi:hypothetical protein